MLADPTTSAADGVRRATAIARLTYRSADSETEVESPRSRFTDPLVPIEADDLSWYLERYIIWPSGVFQGRAQAIERNLPPCDQLLFDRLSMDAARNELEAWKATPAGVERRYMVKVDRELVEPIEERRAKAGESATLLLALPWESKISLHDLLDIGRH